MVSVNQAKKIIYVSKKYDLLFLQENQFGDESIGVKTSLKGCTIYQKYNLEEFPYAYRGVFWDPNGIPPKREVEHDI